MNTISVIIPVYNNSEYLEQCLNSIRNQTYDDLQIICIDDGSTDGAGIIADRFASEDQRFTVIHQENHGESYARNVGLRLAEGDYIAFCDCDDWLEPDMYEVLLTEALKHDSEFTAGSWYRETDGSTEIAVNNKAPDENPFGQRQLLRYVYERDVYQGFAYMWNKLYKNELFYDENNEIILFDETLELGGDVLFLARLVLNTGKASYVDRPFYHYRIKSVSGSHTRDLKKLKDWIKAYEKTIEYMKEHNADQDIIDYLIRFLAYRCSNLAEEAYYQGNEKEKKKYQKYMIRYEEVYNRLNSQHPEWIERYRRIYNL